MDPFRAPGRSSVLSALAQAGATDLPRHARKLPAAKRTERLELAADVTKIQGSVALWVLAGLFTMGVLAAAQACLKSDSGDLTGGAEVFVGVCLCGALLFGVLAMYSSSVASGKRAASVETLLAWPEQLPFPTDGFEDFLVADQPLLDVTLRAVQDRKLFLDAVRAVDATIDCEPIGERAFRFALPARAKTFSGKNSSRTARFGDVALLHKLVDRLLKPLHDEIGIESVQFGGVVEER